MCSLAGKAVVVTGGGRGIGKGISVALAAAGAGVVLNGRDADTLEAAAAEIRARGGRAVVAPGDITSREDLDRLVAAGLEAFGYIDGWVNNAGGAVRSELIDMTEAQWDQVVDLNMKWTFFGMQAAARAMTRGGSIINITSRSGSMPCPRVGQYGAAKAGVENLTATAAVEWGRFGIRVNAIAPGLVITEGLSEEAKQRPEVDTIPLGRGGTVEDVGSLAVFLVSDEAAWISGAVMPLHGGARVSGGLVTYLQNARRPA